MMESWAFCHGDRDLYGPRGRAGRNLPASAQEELEGARLPPRFPDSMAVLLRLPGPLALLRSGPVAVTEPEWRKQGVEPVVSSVRLPAVERLRLPRSRRSCRTPRYLRKNLKRTGRRLGRDRYRRMRTAFREGLSLLCLCKCCQRYPASDDALYKTQPARRLRGLQP